MLYLKDEQATLDFAASCAQILTGGGLVFLEGDLGAGKTTFSRGLIRALGHQGSVKSPTYTLVEVYELPKLVVCHFDLYRLADPEELEFIGIREYLNQGALCLIEWAEKGMGVLPSADITLTLSDHSGGRSVAWSAHTVQGQIWLEQLQHLV